jgi:hypothetical protein
VSIEASFERLFVSIYGWHFQINTAKNNKLGWHAATGPIPIALPFRGIDGIDGIAVTAVVK